MVREVSINFKCNVHRDQDAEVQNVRVFWPATGEIYEFDLCAGCRADLEKVIGPIIEVTTPVSKMAPVIDRDEPPLPRGWIWKLAASKDNNSGGIGREHLVIKNEPTSVCNRATAFFGPATGSGARCKLCLGYLDKATRG